MATGTLTSTTIAARYKSLLKLTGTANDVLAADASAKYVEDGDGNDSVLSLSTTRVGIGNTAPTALLTAGAITTLVTDGTTAVTPEGVNVHITEASKYAMGIKNADASGDGLIIQAGDASDDFALRVEDYDSANDLLVVQGGGAVGIGTASPSNYYSTTLVVDAPDEDGITVVSPTTGTGYLMFADGTSGNARYRGYISYAHASDKLQFATGGSPRMSIDSSGNVGIGMTPAKLLDLQASDNLALRYYNGATFKAGVEVATTIGDMISSSAVDDLAIRSQANMLFSTGGNTERMRIDSSGYVNVGHATNLALGPAAASTLQIANTLPQMAMLRSADNEAPPHFNLTKSRGAAPGTIAIVENGDRLGQISFSGDDGNDYQSMGAYIQAKVDGTPGEDDMPGRLIFGTTASGAVSPTDRLTIDSAGNFVTPYEIKTRWKSLTVGNGSYKTVTFTHSNGDFVAGKVRLIGRFTNGTYDLGFKKEIDWYISISSNASGTTDGTVSETVSIGDSTKSNLTVGNFAQSDNTTSTFKITNGDGTNDWVGIVQMEYQSIDSTLKTISDPA